MISLDTGIYEIINTANGKRYVGSAKSLRQRLRMHLKDLQKDKHPNRYLQFAWNKYGEGSFDFRVILYCDKVNLLFYEQRALDFYNILYNLAPTAGSQLGWKMPDEVKEKISKAKTGKSIVQPPRTKEYCQAIAEANKGRIQSPETRKKRSDSSKGRVPWNKGKTLTDDQRANLMGRVPWNKGKTGVYSPETLAKIGAASTGRVFSDESKEQMRISHLGLFSGEKNPFYGKKHSPETRAKITAANKLRHARRREQT